MAYVAIAGAVVGVVSNMQQQQEAARMADKKREADVEAARLNFKSTEASVNMMKAANREAATNTIQEALRVGASQDKRVKQEIETVTSQLSASNEGITSGRSKGRQMISLQVKGNQAVMDSRSKTSSAINQITDQMDQATNDLNNKLWNDYNQMATVLLNPGAEYRGNSWDTLNSGMSGAQAGASLGGSFGLYDK